MKELIMANLSAISLVALAVSLIILARALATVNHIRKIESVLADEIIHGSNRAALSQILGPLEHHVLMRVAEGTSVVVKVEDLEGTLIAKAKIHGTGKSQ